MTTNLMTAIRESGASVWSTGCAIVPTARDLDAFASREPMAQRAGSAVDGTPHIGAAAAAKTTPGTTVWSPPT